MINLILILSLSFSSMASDCQHIIDFKLEDIPGQNTTGIPEKILVSFYDLESHRIEKVFSKYSCESSRALDASWCYYQNSEMPNMQLTQTDNYYERNAISFSGSYWTLKRCQE